MRLISLWLVLLPLAATAQENESWRIAQVQLENDAFWGQGIYSVPDDRFYTSGLRVSASKGRFGSEAQPASQSGSLPGWLRPVRSRCAGCGIFPSIAIGQEIYTPEDLENPDPQPGDHPWAAWLYAGFGAAVYPSERTRHSFEVQFGVTGDPAGGKFVQKLWHQLINSPEPKGWEHQFGPDFGVNAYYSYERILRPASAGNGVDWDFVPNVKLAAGTMRTHASVGGTFRFGKNITGFPYSSIHPHDTRVSATLDKDVEVYGFVGADVRAVAHNYFLEGSRFHDDPYTVTARSSVWDFTFGMTARYRRYYVTYAIVRRSEEFDRTAGTDSGVHAYGSLTLTVALR